MPRTATSAPRERLLRRVATRFLRWRPLIVGPCMVVGLLCLIGSHAPRAQLVGMGAGFAVMLAFFSYEARVSRAQIFSARRVQVSLQLTLLGLTLGSLASGGLDSPICPLLFAPVVVGLAAFGLDPHGRVLLQTLVLTLALLVLGTLRPPFPPLPPPFRQIFFAAALLDALVLVHAGVGAFTHAHAELIDELQSARDGLLDEALARTRSVEALGARVAHEIKNPLASVRGLVDLLGEGLESPRDLRRIEVLRGEVARLEALVQEYLTLARPLDELRKTPTSLASLVGETTTLLEGRAARAEVTLTAALPLEPVIAEVDGHRLLVALLNLVVNAVEATPPGGSVEIALQQSGEAVFLEVRDTGTGIAVELRGRMGVPYLTTKASGTGLGVALARSIVEHHGGHLSFAAHQPSGTVATVELPLRSPEDNPVVRKAS